MCCPPTLTRPTHCNRAHLPSSKACWMSKLQVLSVTCKASPCQCPPQFSWKPPHQHDEHNPTIQLPSNWHPMASSTLHTFPLTLWLCPSSRVWAVISWDRIDFVLSTPLWSLKTKNCVLAAFRWSVGNSSWVHSEPSASPVHPDWVFTQHLELYC